MANSFFHYLETCTKAEREQIAFDLKEHYNALLYAESAAFEATFSKRSSTARAEHKAAIDALGHVQAVFDNARSRAYNSDMEVIQCLYSPCSCFHFCCLPRC